MWPMKPTKVSNHSLHHQLEAAQLSHDSGQYHSWQSSPRALASRAEGIKWGRTKAQTVMTVPWAPNHAEEGVLLPCSSPCPSSGSPTPAS